MSSVGVVPSDLVYPSVPADLQEVIEEDPSRDSGTYCKELRSYCDRDNYTWGFKIYRTINSPGSDADFEKALEVLLALMRFECFYDAVRENDGDSSGDDLTAEERAYYEDLPFLSEEQWKEVIDNPNHPYHRSSLVDRGDGEGEERDQDHQSEEEERGEIIDDRSNQQLWQRLENDIEQDFSRLQDATPAQLQDMFKEWIYDRQDNPSGSSRYRFFIIMDHEVVENLSRIPLPLPKSLDIDGQIQSVKVFDTEFNPQDSRLSNPEKFHPQLVARLSKDEGWFWTAGDSLARLFFLYRNEEFGSVRDWDDQDRPRFSDDGFFFCGDSAYLCDW